MKSFLKFATAATLLILSTLDARAIDYAGTLNEVPIKVALTWLGEHVTGAFTPQSDSADVHFLAGDNSTEGKINLTVTNKGKNIAKIAIEKELSDTEIIWEGTITFLADGVKFPIKFSRQRV